jgi:hypothetical protein
MDTKVRYCHWEEGIEKPESLPPNCEWSEDGIKWFTELLQPKAWSGDYKRRWPSRMNAFDDLFIRTCKNLRLNTVYRFKRIMAKRCALETQHVGMYNVTLHLWDIIQKYNLAPDMSKLVQEFMRPLYCNDSKDLSTWNGLCRKGDYPDFGKGKDTILPSFIIARTIIRSAETKKFTDISTPAWFKNKYRKPLTK